MFLSPAMLSSVHEYICLYAHVELGKRMDCQHLCVTASALFARAPRSRTRGSVWQLSRKWTQVESMQIPHGEPKSQNLSCRVSPSFGWI